MSTKFTIASRMNPSKFEDVVSVGDSVLYSFDFTPWQEDNAAITSVTWTLESGQASIINQALAAGIATALISFAGAGDSVISILATTATAKKKVWLRILADNQQLSTYDYGLNNG